MCGRCSDCDEVVRWQFRDLFDSRVVTAWEKQTYGGTIMYSACILRIINVNHRLCFVFKM